MTNQPPKDFLALSHGNEWVNFYESFDQLVQDHLSRSSELLRKAMSLPEVADREVAQIRDDLEGRLTSERERNTATLTALKQEIGNTQQQASGLVRLVAAMIGDLDRLSTNVDDALNQAVAEASVPLPESDPQAVANAVEEMVEVFNGTAELNPDAIDSSVFTPTAESELSWAELTIEAQAASDETEPAEDESEIDLTALAAMESELESPESPAIEAEAETVEESERGTESDGVLTEEAIPERTRPHWLSMARSSSDS